MTLSKSFPTDSATGLPVADNRLLVAGMVSCDASGNPRAGVLPSNYNAIVTGTSGMAYSVGAFSAVTVRSGFGAEIVSNDGAVSVATTSAPGANSRIDVIWVRSQFATYADGSSDPVFGVTQGSAAASPTKPSIPAGALELATAVILSSTTQTSTAVITQTHPYTAMQGGVVALRDQSEQNGWGPASGSLAFRLDTGTSIVRKGTAWVVPVAGGSVNTGTDGSGRIVVTHGMGTTPKSVAVTLDATQSVIPDRLTFGVDAIGSTTFRVTVYRQDSGGVFAGNPCRFYWSALS